MCMHDDQTKCFENNKVDVTILSLSFLFLCTIRMLRLACLCWQGHLPSLILTARHISTLYSSVQDACKSGFLSVGLWAGRRASDIPGSDVPVLSLVQLENMPAVVGHNAQTVTCLFFVGAGDHSKSEPAQLHTPRVSQAQHAVYTSHGETRNQRRPSHDESAKS